jgi:hypothetical protein
MADDHKAGGIKIPGIDLELPTSRAGAWTLCVIFLCLSITAIAVTYIISHAPVENLKQVGSMMSAGGVKTYNYKGDQLSALHTRRQFQFMTPSLESWKTASDRYGVTNNTKFEWMKVSQDRIDDFGNRLIKDGFTQGWRRYPYEGQGHYRDVGWWWIITVDEDFDVDRFVKFYLNFWNTQEMYLEEFDTFGDVLPYHIIPKSQLTT